MNGTVTRPSWKRLEKYGPTLVGVMSLALGVFLGAVFPGGIITGIVFAVIIAAATWWVMGVILDVPTANLGRLACTTGFGVGVFLGSLGPMILVGLFLIGLAAFGVLLYLIETAVGAEPSS